MMRAPIRIVFAILAVGFLAGIIYVSVHLYQEEFRRDSEARKEIENQGERPVPDPGKNKFAQAIDLLREGDLDTARGELFELVRIYKDSSKHGEAKRIIGEINMDALLEPKLGPGKKEYIVQRGDALSLIARKNDTTILCIQRTNGMFDTMIHPGDRLIVFPLDFSIVIDVDAKTLTLIKKERFFKEYPAREIKISPRVRVPFESTIASRSEDKKWLHLKSGGVVIAPAIEEGSEEVEQPSFGIFLDPADMEELFTIIRTSTPVKVVQ